jgi:molybdate transport system substrate-binding protein
MPDPIFAAAPFAGSAFMAASLLAATVNAAEIKVVSSPAASAALAEVSPQFERATGHKVVLEFANIAAWRKRIGAGETFDIAVVGPKLIEDLIQDGKIAAGTQYMIGRTGLAVVTRKGGAKPDISSADAFKRALLGARSVGHSATGESGIGFMAVLDRLGIANAMKPTLRPSANLTDSVAAGEVDFGVSGIGFAVANPKVDFVGPVPHDVQAYVNLAAGISANAKDPQAARALLKFFSDPAVVQVMKAKGLEPY